MKIILKKILPKRLWRKLSSWRNDYFGYYLKSYSQEGEDMILRRIFEEQEKGFYIDVGAHHPKRFSNTYFFYKRGWHGINIDAMPNSMKLFKKFRPRDINIEAAISDCEQELTYYEFNEPALNGFSETISLQRNNLKNYRIINSYKLTTKRLDYILLSNGIDKSCTIDFLSIDVEGLDMQVLKSIDLGIFKPKVILIEVLQNAELDLYNNDVSLYLFKFGYRLFAKTYNTILFLRVDNATPLG